MSRFIIKKFRLKSKFYIRLLQIMGIFGAGFLASCIKQPEVKYGAPTPMYGVQVNEIKFYGTIKSADSLRDIPGLTVRLVNNNGWDSVQTITDYQGKYNLYFDAFEGDVLKLKIYDTDSTLNVGYFKNTVVDITVSQRDVNNMEHEADVQLQKK